MKDCSTCPHAAERNGIQNYESSHCKNCHIENVTKQFLKEPEYNIEKNIAYSKFLRRLSCVRQDIVIYMLEHPELTQIEAARRLNMPRATFSFHFHRIKRMLPELFR